MHITKKLFRKTIFFFLVVGLIAISGYFVFSRQQLIIEEAEAVTNPQITSAPQAMEHKQNITISGAGFGAKATAAPVAWDDFETGTPGQKIAPNNGWQQWAAFDPVDVTYTDLNPRSGSTISSYHDVTHSNPTLGKWVSNWTEVYVSYWIRHHITLIGTSGGPKNLKEFKIYGNLNSNKDPQFGLEISSTDLPCTLGGRFQSGGDESTMDWGMSPAVNDEWVRREFWIRITDELGQAFRHYLNATLRRHYPTPEDWPGDSGIDPETGKWVSNYPGLPSTSIGPYMGDYDGRFTQIWFLPFIRGGSTGYTLFDDLYIDTTQARVEIGNASTWDECTHREIQIPTAWSSTSITFTANQGSFTNGTTVYLYVVDENGNVNEQGWPVSFGDISDGDTPDTTPPAPPTGVRVE